MDDRKCKEANVLRVLNSDVTYDFYASREAEAILINCVCVYPTDNQLQVDCDSDAAYKRFCAAKDTIDNNLPDLITGVSVTVSKSGLPHRHITVTLSQNFSTLERIALQFMFGSDYIRESLSALRFLCDIDAPICFFEPKK